MSVPLQKRARAFLERAVPAGLDYVPNSLAERWIKTYAKRGRISVEPATLELMELVIAESQERAGGEPLPEVADYFRESTALLEAIHTEASQE